MTPTFPRHIFDLAPRIHLFQRCDYLRFPVLNSRHTPSPQILSRIRDHSWLCADLREQVISRQIPLVHRSEFVLPRPRTFARLTIEARLE